jgi:hypothetical protein
MKIVSVGCSFTEGTGVGRHNAYTRHLADLCNCEYDNFGEGGHSNKYVFRKTISLLKNWNKEDILLVQWTGPNREEVVTKEGYIFYSPHNNFMSLEFLFGQDVANNPKAHSYTNEKQKEIIEKYGKIIDDYTYNLTNNDYSITSSLCYQISTFNMLENLGIKHINFFGWDAVKLNDVYDFTNEKFLDISFGKYTNTPMSEHPDLEGHVNWAKYLFDKLKNFNYI